MAGRKSTPTNDKSRWVIAVVLVGGLLAAGLLYDRGYDPVGEKAYQYAIALNTVCNQRNDKKLPLLKSMIGDALAEESITPTEHEWLIDIIESAEQGKWPRAEEQIRRLLEDQVEK